MFGSSDDETHPAIKYLFRSVQQFYVGGSIEAVDRLEHYDFLDLRCECFFPVSSPVLSSPVLSSPVLSLAGLV